VNEIVNLSQQIKDWVNESNGCFNSRQLDIDLDIKNKQGKDLKRKVLSNLVKDGILQRVGEKDGLYRRFEKELKVVDWQGADSNATVDLVLPFGLEDYVKIFPKSIIVVAGASNAGKTAYLYNFIMMNMRKHIIDLYNSETSPEQMKDRFANFDIEIPNPCPFNVYERYDMFADVIDPNRISVIDYIDYSSEVYRIGEELEALHRKLNKGIVVAAIQKKQNTKNFKGEEVKFTLGYGSDMSLKKASLYLTLDPGKMRIVKAKSWKDHNCNPNGMEFKFKLVKGAKFIVENTDELSF
jgi:hypothetical protein